MMRSHVKGIGNKLVKIHNILVSSAMVLGATHHIRGETHFTANEWRERTVSTLGPRL